MPKTLYVDRVVCDSLTHSQEEHRVLLIRSVEASCDLRSGGDKNWALKEHNLPYLSKLQLTFWIGANFTAPGEGASVKAILI